MHPLRQIQIGILVPGISRSLMATHHPVTHLVQVCLHLVKGNRCFTNCFAWCIELGNTLKAELFQGCHCFWRISPWSPTCFFGMWINSAHDFFTLCHDAFRFRLLPLIESQFFCGTWAVGFRFLEGAPPKKKKISTSHMFASSMSSWTKTSKNRPYRDFPLRSICIFFPASTGMLGGILWSGFSLPGS